MVIYFLLGYHYSLLKISKDQLSRMPGFLMLDFPAEIEGEKVADHENFVIEPFISLSNSPGYENVQVIAAGSGPLRASRRPIGISSQRSGPKFDPVPRRGFWLRKNYG